MTDPRRPRRLPREEIARKNSPLGKVENTLKDNPLINGKRKSGIVLSSSETKIRHGLNNGGAGYLILSQNAPASIYRVELTFPPIEPDTEEKMEKQRQQQEYSKLNDIILKASTDVTVTIWFF